MYKNKEGRGLMQSQKRRVSRDKGVSEVFGYPADATGADVLKVRDIRFCPYLGSRCEKVSQHRSMPADLPFGACSVLYWSEEQQTSVPYIICPYRFVERGTIFKDAQRLFGAIAEGTEVFLIPEIDFPVGRLDYIVAVREGVDIKRFLVLEVMAISTTQTGAVIRSFLDTLQGREKTQTYNYGINWRQVVSRMVVQMLAKVRACAEWNVPMVWVVQDVFYNYCSVKAGLTG
jgi:hypothetical protein